jgi:hypothetical protein
MRLDGLAEKTGSKVGGFGGMGGSVVDNNNRESVRDGTFSFGPSYYDDYDDPSMMDVEIRPIRRRDAVEAGLDYWMDEADLSRERRRRIDIRDRRRRKYATSSSSTTTTTTSGSGGGMSTDRLREEVVAPYKQNWIGWLSIFFVAMSTIVTKFPELLQIPIIPIPDL